MMYLYAITDRAEGPMPTPRGLDNAPLRSLPYRDIGAVVSAVGAARLPVTEASLWQHEAVVETLMANRTVLPLRFGTLIPDEAAVRDILEAHYADFAACLERVQGHVEIGLRVLCDAVGRDREPSPKLRMAHPTGRAYLLARAEQERQSRARREWAEALAAELHHRLADLASDTTRRVLITPRLLLTAAYLIERDRVSAFQLEVRAVSAAYPALQLLCTGPWPPYSFVTTCVPGGKATGAERCLDRMMMVN